VQGILLGLVVGFMAVCALLAGPLKFAGSVGVSVGGLGGLGIGGLLVWLRLRFWRKAQARADQDLAAKAEALLTEFPQECQAWGGLTALRDPDLVKEMIRAAKVPT
jgi:hypothetical protein